MKRLLVAVLVMLLATLPIALAEDQDQGTAVSTAGPSTERAPGQLTTLFAANNGFAGNFFDIEPAASLTEITAVDVNHNSAGELIDIDVYYKAGTCVGFETDPGAWTLLGSGSSIAAGPDLPTNIDLAGNGVSFDSGSLYGIYVFESNYSALSGYIGYTNAPGPQTYANAELSATCYFGSAFPAFSGVFTYRIWNGTIYYETGPPVPLSVNPKQVSAWFGGSVLFKLNGGPDMAGRSYGLFGTASGTAPGTPLPGGLVLPVNWDWFTQLLYTIAVYPGNGIAEGFLGNLDNEGYAEATLILPGHCLTFDDLLSDFAWCSGFPYDSVSNSVELLITGAPPG